MQGYIVEEQALQITHDNNFGRPSHGRSSFRGRGRGRERQGTDKSLVECFYCHDLGHFQYECPRKGRRNESQVNFTEAINDEPLLLMAYTELEETEKLCSEDENLCSDAPNILEDDDHTMEMSFMALELCNEDENFMVPDHTIEMSFMAPELCSEDENFMAPDFIEERLDKELYSYCEGPEIPADAENEPMMEMTDNHTMEMLLMAHVEKALDETWFLDSGCKPTPAPAHEEDNGFFDYADNQNDFHDIADNHDASHDATDASHQGNLEHPVAEEQQSADSISRGGNRQRQPPIWMRYYDSGDVYSDDNQGNFALFVDEDPLSYENAARSAK
ncbi:hypothetical protein Peur_050889 [Populus x canadensis]